MPTNHRPRDLETNQTNVSLNSVQIRDHAAEARAIEENVSRRVAIWTNAEKRAALPSKPKRVIGFAVE